MGEWVIESATVEALPHILEIEEACFSAPWTRKMLEAELSGNPFAYFLVAKRVPQSEVGSVSIVGYLCFWVVFEEVRLMNLAVIESMRRKGVARPWSCKRWNGTGPRSEVCCARSAGFKPCRACPLPQSWISRRDDPVNVLFEPYRRCIADGTGPDRIGVRPVDTRRSSQGRIYHAITVISSPGGATC